MSEQERYAWASLGATALVWAFFTMHMTEGGWIADVSPGHMLWTYVATVVLMTVSHSIIAVWLAALRRRAPFRDERDAAIAARADRIEGYVLAVVINVLVVHALAEAVFAGHALPRVDLGSLPTLVVVLLSMLFAGHVVKQVAIIWQYRA
jgi:hypothetical protein